MTRRYAIPLAALLTVLPTAALAQTKPREVNVTPDSAPGWLPSEDLERQALDAMRAYFAAWDSGKADQAYALMTPINREATPYPDFQKATATFNAESGALIARRVLKITWTKDPSDAPSPGIYVAIDESARYAGISRQCGYVILFQAPTGGPFQLMRVENSYISDASAAKMAPGEADAQWKKLSAVCPDYTPAG